MSEHDIAPRKSAAFAFQMTALFLLRVGIGWHFLYEGLAKLYAPNWSSADYLQMSRWIFAPFFHWIASTPAVLKAVDLANVWGLIAIGGALILGCLTRLAALMGILLLLLYYAANPPLVGLDFGVPVEGHYLIVNKNVVEVLALLAILVFPAGRFLGIDGVLAAWRRRRKVVRAAAAPAEGAAAEAAAPPPSLVRRELLGSLATAPFVGAFVVAFLKKRGWESYEESRLKDNLDAMSSATIKTFDFSSLKDLAGTLPQGKLGGVSLSRMVLGGNLIGGWAHARDLIYVSKLVKAYHHKAKIFETFMLAERCGINTILTNPVLCEVINEYWRRRLGKIQFISDCGGKNLTEGTKRSIDAGACACYVHGGMADDLAKRKKFDEIGNTVELIRRNGLPAGVGAHELDTVKGCVEAGIKPDFWMKTLHKTDYWSAQAQTEHDNIFCRDPEGTIEYMKSLEQPWIAFKTLAAGAIQPKAGFRYAFKNGADFICVGMYDFQIVDDVNLVLGILGEDLKRQRPWRA